MSTAAVSSSSLNQQIQQYFHTRQGDLRQLGQALSSGDVAGAQAAYKNIVTLGQSGPFSNGNPFRLTAREKDFNAVGQALQSGDLAGASQAFDVLKATFQGGGHQPLPPVPSPAASPSPVVPLPLKKRHPSDKKWAPRAHLENSSKCGVKRVAGIVRASGSAVYASSTSVTGPSFTSSTAIFAPNTPVSTVTPSATSSAQNRS